jgi:hypothetical protein
MSAHELPSSASNSSCKSTEKFPRTSCFPPRLVVLLVLRWMDTDTRPPSHTNKCPTAQETLVLFVKSPVEETDWDVWLLAVALNKVRSGPLPPPDVVGEKLTWAVIRPVESSSGARLNFSPAGDISDCSKLSALANTRFTMPFSPAGGATCFLVSAPFDRMPKKN